MVTVEQVRTTVESIILAAIAEAKRLKAEDEQRLGRQLTESELEQIADLVGRQTRLAIKYLSI